MKVQDMKERYRKFRRAWGTWYAFDNATGDSVTLKTRDKVEAVQKVNAMNEAEREPSISLGLARVYLNATDPKLATRTWQEVMENIVSKKTDETRRRWEVAIKDRNFDCIRKLPVAETRPEHFDRVLADGKVSSNVYLRRIHNHALGMEWLLKSVIPRLQWPKVRFKDKRAIKFEEHQSIVAREQNAERKAFYLLAWHLGASQSDIAFLEAKNVDWEHNVISFARKKTGSIALMRFDEEMAAILRSLPASGPLFPYLRTVRAGDRATEFKQRCESVGVKGVSLHSYRYAWAERAKKAGYPERFAQEALGHNSKAVHRAYARNAQVELPALGDYERQRAMFRNGQVAEPVARVVNG
jgi:integrase